MRCNSPLAAVRAVMVSLLFLFSTAGLAAPTTDPADVINPVIEDFEGYTGVSIPASGFGPTYGLPPTGFVFDSGLVLTGPSPNTDDGLVIGDDTGYGCCGGSVNTSTIISGTAFAADGNPAGALHTFMFPSPTLAFGLYFASDAVVTLTAYDGGGAIIDTQVFTQLSVPMTAASFIGIVSPTPVASFSIESAGFFAYDDVTFSDASGILYGINRDNDTLVSVDPVSFAATTVGSLGTDDNFGGLAYDVNTDTMYMSGGRGNNSIYTVNYATGAATLLGAHGINDVFGLAFDSTNNILYGSTTGGELYSFSQSDGSATLVGATGVNLGGLAYDSTLDRLIAITTGGTSIYELNRTDGSATPLAGELPSTNDIGFTYDFDNDIFYSLGLNGTLHSYLATDFTASLLASGLPVVDGLTYVNAAPVQLADLTISKTDSPDPVVAGTTLTYTLRVDNIGGAPADDVVVTDTLPTGLSLDSTSGCVEDPSGAPSCSLGTIAAGGFAEYTITATVDPSAAGLLLNTATVTTSSSESNVDNNTVIQETTVTAEADLSITKMGSDDPVISGGNQTLVYTIEVSNAGPSDATNVVVTDNLSPLAIFQSTSGCLNDPVGVPDCQLGTIPAGGSASYTITVLLQRSGGVISNSASVSSDASDPNGDNDSVEELTDVIPIAIPTLNSLGLMMLILLLAGFGWVGIRRT